MILSLSVIVLINIMDSVMGSIQGPSVIFYVEMMGGTLKECEFMYISFLFMFKHNTMYTNIRKQMDCSLPSLV